MTVPKAYGQPGQWVVDFSAPIVDAVPLARGRECRRLAGLRPTFPPVRNTVLGRSKFA